MVVAWTGSFRNTAGMVVVCSGTDAAARPIARVLTNDPATGVMRQAGAGYKIVINCAPEQDLQLPMLQSQVPTREPYHINTP